MQSSIAGILVFVACRYPFIRNPHLRLLCSDGYSDEHPAVAPNGNEVYYLSGNTLWKLDINKDSASLLRQSWYQAIALSPDGTRLALLGHDLLLADTTGALLETLVPSESLGEDPVDVQFSHDGSHVYYSIGSELDGADYYRVALDGTGRELVHQSIGSAETPLGQSGFALTKDDSILDYRAWPQLSPTDDDVMAYADNFFDGGDIYLVRLSSDSVTNLRCGPYSSAETAYPSWFPDGHRLVFCATVNPASSRFELWMLDSVEY
jgi:Tol biopolymer transport system component